MIAALYLLGSLQDQEIEQPYDIAAKKGYAANPDNGYLDYLKAASSFTGTVSGEYVTKYMATGVEHGGARGQLAAKYGAAWKSVQDGNRKFVADPGWALPAASGTGVPVGPFVNLSKLGSALGEASFASGDATAGWNFALDSWLMGYKLSSSGITIHYLVGLLVQSVAFADIKNADGLMPEPIAVRVLQTVPDELEAHPLLVMQGRGEMLTAKTLHEMSAEDGDKFLASVAEELKVDAGELKRELPDLIELLRQGEDYYSHLAGLPEGDWEQGLKQRADALAQFKLSAYIITPNQRHGQYDRWCRTQMRLMVAHALVSQYYWVNGRFPGSLAEAGRLVSDPYSGRELNYEAVGNRFELSAATPQGALHLGDPPPVPLTFTPSLRP